MSATWNREVWRTCRGSEVRYELRYGRDQIGLVFYQGHRRWHGSCSWQGRFHWFVVGSPLRARRIVQSWLDRQWDGPVIENPA